MLNAGNLHVIILAGGEDLRLAPLTSALSGMTVPKQFAFIAGNGSLLQQTVSPYAAAISPKRIAVVVSSVYEDLARTQLRAWEGIAILPRPANHGPALDLVFALGRLMALDASSTVMVSPAHHYVPHAGVLVGSLAAASPTLTTVPVILAGATVGSGGGHHFVVPGTRLEGAVHALGGLVDHASPAQTERLKKTGALWNTSVFVARAADLWQLCARQMPEAAEVVLRLWAKHRKPPSALAGIFSTMRGARLGDILGSRKKDVGVLSVEGSDWTDWTTPEQVIDSLSEQGEVEWLLSRIFRRQQALGRTEWRRPLPAAILQAWDADEPVGGAAEKAPLARSRSTLETWGGAKQAVPPAARSRMSRRSPEYVRS